jgi:hypothetical protein
MEKRKRPLWGIKVLLIIMAGYLMAFPWSDVGHKTIAIIAEKNLRPETLKKIKQLLPNGETMMDLSIEADNLTKTKPATAFWHYINLPVYEDIGMEDVRQYESKGRREGNNVISQTKKNFDFLKTGWGSHKEKQEALMYLIHFMGDVHMPLHVGDDNYQRGSRRQVVFFRSDAKTDRGRSTNLHVLWDNLIEVKAVDDPEELGKKLGADISIAEKGEWGKGTVENWAYESYQVAKKVYANIPRRRVIFNLPRNYYAKMRPIADKQLEKAGIRLAILLEELFGK